MLYQTLEDTTVELWVLDLTPRRRLGVGDGGPLARSPSQRASSSGKA